MKRQKVATDAIYKIVWNAKDLKDIAESLLVHARSICSHINSDGIEQFHRREDSKPVRCMTCEAVLTFENGRLIQT